MNIEKYLARIGMEGVGVVPDIAGLKLLQRQHLLNVPFENLDIHWKRPIAMDTGSFYKKMINENRGGFCYELNGLFNELLRKTGFETRLLSAPVADGGGNFSPEFDHLAILVIMSEMQYLADVGFGAFTAEPLKFVADVDQNDPTGTYTIRRVDAEHYEVAKQEDFGWKGEYMFRPFGRDLSEFDVRCRWHQSSPESHFMMNKVCSLMTESGRKTLTDDKYIVTVGDERTETAVGSPEVFDQILLREFGISRTAPSRAVSLVDQLI